MKKIKSLCVASILFTLPIGLAAQTLSDTTISNALLWQVSGNGLNESSYLYGTMHIYCSQQIILPEILKEKIQSSKKVFLEINADKSDSSENNWLQKKYFAYDYRIKDIIGDSNFITASNIINNYKPVNADTLKKNEFFGLAAIGYPFFFRL